MMNILKDKRGLSLGDLYPAVLVIIVIGIALGIGIFILDETARATATTPFTIQDEIFTYTALHVAVGEAGLCGFSTMVVTNVTITNDSAATGNINSGNYSVDATGGTIQNISGAPWDFATWNISYTHIAAQNGTSSCSAINTTSTGLAGFATWIAVIVVVIAAAIVLGVVISSFGGTTRAI